MASPRLLMQVVRLIWGNTMMIKEKDMEHLSGLMERDTLGSGCNMPKTGTEYKGGQVEIYIKDFGNKIKEKVMHIKDGLVPKNIMDR
jgi:hypothetical protein